MLSLFKKNNTQNVQIMKTRNMNSHAVSTKLPKASDVNLLNRVLSLERPGLHNTGIE